MKKQSMSFGASIKFRRNLELTIKERTAVKPSGTGGYDCLFQTWPNRASMAKSIRMQQSRMPKSSDWIALIPLTDGEGY